MAEQEKQEQQKTVVSFVVGLLIGGLLVWAFSGPETNEPQKDTKATATTTEEVSKTTDSETKPVEENKPVASSETNVERPTLPVGDGSVAVSNQAASNAIVIANAVYPISEGWVGVREFTDGQLGHLLGVVRFSEEQGIVPNNIALQRPTTAGREYAVVVYRDNGDRTFNLAEDAQIDEIFATFRAE